VLKNRTKIKVQKYIFLVHFSVHEPVVVEDLVVNMTCHPHLHHIQSEKFTMCTLVRCGLVPAMGGQPGGAMRSAVSRATASVSAASCSEQCQPCGQGRWGDAGGSGGGY
jgi:hypothetical protein